MLIRFADIVWPTASQYWLVNTRIPVCLLSGIPAIFATPDAEGVVGADLLIEGGKLARVVPSGQSHGGTGARVDIGHRQVWPTLVDIHTHLDKGHTVERNPNVDGTFHNARLAAVADRPNWTAADLRIG